MGLSAGTGSPVWFRCAKERESLRSIRGEHVVTLTGRERPYRASKGHALGTRSTYISREYRCSCGHVGWSNHMDLARRAGAGLDDHIDRPRTREVSP